MDKVEILLIIIILSLCRIIYYLEKDYYDKKTRKDLMTKKDNKNATKN